jgi:hypothetical protein
VLDHRKAASAQRLKRRRDRIAGDMSPTGHGADLAAGQPRRSDRPQLVVEAIREAVAELASEHVGG